MVTMLIKIATIACVLNLANCLLDPYPGFKPCLTADEVCLLENAKKGVTYFANGIPELGVKTMDPDHFDRVDASSPNLKFILTDITSTGLKTCKPLKVKRNAEQTNIFVQLQCAVKLDGNYEMDGQILLLKIAGKGKIHAFLRNLDIKVTIDYVFKEGKDGKRHIRIKKFDHSYELKEKSDLEFTGLFQDNAVLSQATNDLIKNNGNDVIREIGDEVFKAAITRIVENFNRFFEKADYEEISLD